ncbi:MAG: DUF4956 domain-containing protein [Clostridia bacterium]|nr:DUF4956 domain-containing protein [Clostridia bacterium]MBQ2720262.1 DUF4956 domain-containing protein [Clostridia bacterium]
MSFSDIIKNSVLSEFSGELSLSKVILSIVLAFVISLFIIFIYKVTFRGVVFNKGFALSLVLLAVVTSAIIMTVTSNLALSLGMVGALSIVRFRTAVKDPVDTVFMFWAVCAGIMTGAGLMFWSLFANVLMGLLYLALCFFSKKGSASQYLLTVRYAPEAAAEVKQKMRSLPKHKIKAKVSGKQSIELSAEIRLRGKDMDLIDSLNQIPGVFDASVIEYQ